MQDMRVDRIMTNLFVALKPSDSIHYAAQRLARNHISGAPVVEDSRVVGVISESDIIRAAYPTQQGIITNILDAITNLGHESTTHRLGGLTVADVMSAPAITATPRMSIWEAAALTERHGIKRLPVVNKDGWLVGVVSRADLVRIMSRNDQTIRTDVLETISILGEEVIESLEVLVEDGVASISGALDRKSTWRLAIELARRTPGIIEVVDHVQFGLNDERLTPAHRAHPADPWATGPLVKEY
ncbi:MAG: CBS domain-containing protein [Actinobacteria bacterium]|nr:CBS domain-containing protein [Actinomycetota bacterium]